MPDMNEMQESIQRHKELQNLAQSLAERIEPERAVSQTEEFSLRYQHYFGDKNPGDVHAELDSAYAEIERLKTKAYHSSGKTWSDMAIQDRSQRAHTSGLLRLLVYCASGTQEDPDGWEIDCRRADYIKASLPRNPNAALEIARIVGVDRAFTREQKAAVQLKPMATAPKPKEDEFMKLLVLDEWYEMGQPCRGWSFVYWLEAFDGRPAGWYGRDCGDLRHPVGWILSTSDLPEIPQV